jgi:GNAT superfamily N-acetyltransferase
MSSPGEDFEVRRVVDVGDEIGKVTALFNEIWPESHVHRRDFLDWLYFENPSGRVIGMNAWWRDRLAAHYVVIPIRATYRGSPVRAALSLNTATHPDFQRRGLFVRLAEATYAAAANEGVHHVVGVGNANSTPGFLGKLEFQHVGQLDVRVGLELPTLLADHPQSDTCWRRVWGEDDLAWRLRNPAGEYRRQGGGGGMAVLSTTGTFGFKAILMLTGAAEHVRTISKALKTQGGVGPRMWMGLSRRLQHSPISLPLPEALKKSPLNLIFRPLADPRCRLDRETVEFEAIDFDAY